MNLFNNCIKAMTVIVSAFAGQAAFAADGITIDHLGVNNTLVRVDGQDGYLMIPVQDSADDAKIDVLVDGRTAETIYVRLAKSKTDFTVPFDLSPYKGKNVIFNIVTPQGRSSVREAKEDACWKSFELSKKFKIKNTDKYRPAYHHTPLWGWMNDPNGMFYKDGTWHLYYQRNPYGSKWQNMTWGHSTSTDLINWEQQPDAIRPDGLGAIFSGSCVIDHNNTAGMGKDAVIALYTSAATSQIQSLAASNDNGTSFTKYAANPVLTLESEARDPNMFWNQETGEWNMVLAHALDHEMLFFTSPDLKTWTLQSAFGKGEGCQDGVWECPDLFELPVEGSNDKKWVLICNINPGGPFGGSAVQYFIGDWNGKKFTADTDLSGKIPTKWLDFGKDNYALVSWSDAPGNRRTVIGWMSNWRYAADVPTMQFRSANTLPREMGLFRAPDGQIYASCAPAPELEALRGKQIKAVKTAKINSKPKTYALPAENGGICEILVDLDTRKAKTISLEMSNNANEKVILTYNSEAHTLSFDRTQSGIVDFSESFPAVTTAPTFEADGHLSLRIFVDRSSMEVFGNGGRCVMTNLVFPTKPYTSLSISAQGGNARISNLKIYGIHN